MEAENQQISLHKLCPVYRITSGAIQNGVPFIDLAPLIVAYTTEERKNKEY